MREGIEEIGEGCEHERRLWSRLADACRKLLLDR